MNTRSRFRYPRVLTQLFLTVRRLGTKHTAHTWREHWVWLGAYVAWVWRVRFGKPRATGNNEEFTAILLSFKRPQNIGPIVRTLLRTPCVGRVIVSNNNPSCHIHNWIPVRSPRLTIIEQTERRSPAIRYRIAAQDPARFFIAVDDDIFLDPGQIEMVCEALRRDPDVPHGVFGQTWDKDGTMRGGIRGVTRELDALNRVYAFTADHLEEFFRLLEVLDLLPLGNMAFGDDMVISASGLAKPMCHDVGRYLDCPTQHEEGIAVWKEEEFLGYRDKLFVRLRTTKPLPSRKDGP